MASAWTWLLSRGCWTVGKPAIYVGIRVFAPAARSCMEIFYDRRHFLWQFACYLDSCTIATAFKQAGTSNFKIVFLNVLTRKVRQLMVEGPVEGAAYFIYLTPKFQLGIIYNFCERDDDCNWCLHLIDSCYDLPPIDAPSSSVNHPSSCESVTIPCGNRGGDCSFDSIYACVIMVFDNTNATHLCISVDGRMKWRLDTSSAWLTSFRNTKMGASVLGAIRGMAALAGNSQEDPPLSYHRFFTPSLRKTEILLHGYPLGILQRRLAPCSLKSSAVESVCKGYPDVKMSSIQGATGVDVSDGIAEDGDGQGEGEVIYL